MKMTHLIQMMAGAALMSLLSLSATAQDELDPAQMEAAMKKYGSPGKEHKALRSWVGTWKTESTYWMQPGAPPMKSTGEARFRMLLKGRYLSETFSYESKEMGPYQGQGTMAYDRVAKEYIHTWIDSMSTGIMISRGQASEDGKSIELKSTNKDYMTMQDVKFRLVSHLGEPKNRKLEMFATYPGKEEFKLMEVIYTKTADAKKGAKAKDATGATKKE